MNGPALVFVGVAVVSMYQPDVETGQTVVVEGDRITYAGPASAATIPRDARRIDGARRSDANPLEDTLSALSPHSVVANGRLYETSDLARLRGHR